MIAVDYVGVATIIAACGAAGASLIAALKANTVQGKVAEVHDQVKTPNGATIGEIVAANDLTGIGNEHDEQKKPA